MAAQAPTQCKNDNNASWMLNDQRQNPCLLLSSTLQQFDTGYLLDFLGVDFTCPASSTNTTTSSSNEDHSYATHGAATSLSVEPSSSSSRSSATIQDACCTSVIFSLFSACWVCQKDQDVTSTTTGRSAVANTTTATLSTWQSYASQCPFQNDSPVVNGVRQRGLIGALPVDVSDTINQSGIHIPSWAFIPVSGKSTWDEASAKLNATRTPASSTATSGTASNSSSKSLSKGCIAGIVIGTLALACVLIIIGIITYQRRRQKNRTESFRGRLHDFLHPSRPNRDTSHLGNIGALHTPAKAEGEGEVEVEKAGRVGTGRAGRGLIGSFGSFGNGRFSVGLWKFGSTEVKPTDNARIDLVSEEDGSPVSAKERQASGYGYSIPALAAQVTRRPSPLGNQLQPTSQPNVYQQPPQQSLPDLYHSQAQALSYQMQAQQQLLTPQQTQPSAPRGQGQMKRTASAAASQAGSVGVRLRASFRRSLARINDGISVPLIPTFMRPSQSTPNANANTNNANTTTAYNAVNSAHARNGIHPASANNAAYTHFDNVPVTMLSRSGSNRYTHPMANPYQAQPNSNETQPYSVPLSPTQMAYSHSQMYPLTTSHSAPVSATAEVGAAASFPLTKEALAVARVAHDGSLFVPTDHAGGKVRGRMNSPGKKKPLEDPLSNNHLVRTISIERTRAMRHAEEQERHREDVPQREDSLRHRLLLHDPDRPVPRKSGRGKGKGRGRGEQAEDEERETSPTALFDPHNQHLLALIPKENQEIESLQPLSAPLSQLQPQPQSQSQPQHQPKPQTQPQTQAQPNSGPSRLVVVNAGPLSSNSSGSNLAAPGNSVNQPTASGSRTAADHLHQASLLYPTPTRSHTIVNRVLNAVDSSMPAPLSKHNLRANLSLNTNLGPNGENLGAGPSTSAARRSKSKDKSKKENLSTKATNGSASVSAGLTSTNTSTQALVGTEEGAGGSGRINLAEEEAAASEFQDIMSRSRHGRERGVHRSRSRSRERKERKERRKKHKSTKVSDSSVVAHASSSSLNDGGTSNPSGPIRRRSSRRHDRSSRSGERGERGRRREPVISYAESGTVMTSPSGGNGSILGSAHGYGLKSDGSRTPSPKIAASSEWLDLFRKGNAKVYTPAALASTIPAARPGPSTSKAIKMNSPSGSAPSGHTHIYLQAWTPAKSSESSRSQSRSARATHANQPTQAPEGSQPTQTQQVRTKDTPLPPLPPVSPASPTAPEPISPTALRIAQLFSDPLPRSHNLSTPNPPQQTQQTQRAQWTQRTQVARAAYESRESLSELPYRSRGPEASTAPAPPVPALPSSLSRPAPAPVASALVPATVSITPSRVAVPRGARERPVRLLPVIPGHRGNDSGDFGSASLFHVGTVHGHSPVHGHGLGYNQQQGSEQGHGPGPGAGAGAGSGAGQADDGTDFERRKTVR